MNISQWKNPVTCLGVLESLVVKKGQLPLEPRSLVSRATLDSGVIKIFSKEDLASLHTGAEKQHPSQGNNKNG